MTALDAPPDLDVVIFTMTARHACPLVFLDGVFVDRALQLELAETQTTGDLTELTRGARVISERDVRLTLEPLRRPIHPDYCWGVRHQTTLHARLDRLLTEAFDADRKADADAVLAAIHEWATEGITP